MKMFKQISLLTVLILVALVSIAQPQTTVQDVPAWQKQINKEYAEKATSPLKGEALANFKGFEFFEEDTKLAVIATLVLSKEKKEIALKTSSSFMMKQIEYGQIHFTIDGKNYSLTVYQSPTHLKEKGFEDYLFFPFTDETNGVETYGGGRYIDLKIPEQGDTIIVNFNKAYNPYCAYTTGYSCPKVPEKNNLPIKILGGVKYVSPH